MLTTTLTHFGAVVPRGPLDGRGHGGVEWLRADVVISDIAMPGEDGYALIRKLRDLEPELGRGIPAMALTAYGRPEHHARIASSGFQRYVQKPVEPETLGHLIRQLVGEIRGALKLECSRDDRFRPVRRSCQRLNIWTDDRSVTPEQKLPQRRNRSR